MRPLPESAFTNLEQVCLLMDRVLAGEILHADLLIRWGRSFDELRGLTGYLPPSSGLSFDARVRRMQAFSGETRKVMEKFPDTDEKVVEEMRRQLGNMVEVLAAVDPARERLDMPRELLESVGMMLAQGALRLQIMMSIRDELSS